MDTLVGVSDTHFNSTVGLWPPGIRLVDGGLYALNPFQESLWKWWLAFCKQVPKKSIVVFNGDLVDGIHPHRNSQIVTTSNAVMRAAAVKGLEPLLDRNVKLYVVRGTDFHDNTNGDDIEDIARQVGAIPDDRTGAYTSWDLWLDFEDKIFQFTHHIGVSFDNPMNALWRELQRAKREAIDNGQAMPDVIVRSHIHVHNVVPDGRFLAVALPGMQAKTGYVYKHNSLSVPDLGGVFFTVQGGSVRWDAKLFPLPKLSVRKA